MTYTMKEALQPCVGPPLYGADEAPPNGSLELDHQMGCIVRGAYATMAGQISPPVKTDDLTSPSIQRNGMNPVERGCKITDFGAVDGNRTSDAHTNAAALQAALGICERITVPKGTFKIAPVTLPSNRILFLEAGSSLVGSDRWQDYGVTKFMPPIHLPSWAIEMICWLRYRSTQSV